ncbi:MAG TPA: peptidylprolyl isomerase [Pyrinomonadaceae bacterium]|jgi:peptidyl-prolyl cis-trans isomerase B (cyclophilin B)
MLRNLTLIAFCLIALAVAASAQKKSTDAEVKPQTLKKSNPRPAGKSPKAEPFEKATIEAMSAQCVKLETEAGVIALEMFPESAPESVRNFLNLAAIGAFDTTTFSRVVPRFVIQGGNLSTREKQTPELAARSRRTIPDEPNQIKHERGTLSVARANEPNTASTHFFILVDSAPSLDGTFAAFGRVTQGMEVVDAINKMPVENEKPAKPVRITRAAVAPCAPPATTPK